MSKSAAVLGIPHPLQGPGFMAYIDDPAYTRLVKSLIKADVDFIFEENGSHGRSIAEDLTESVLGPGHYMDIDPPFDERPKYGIEQETGGMCPIDPFQNVAPGVPHDTYRWELVDVHRKREELWLQRIQAQSFERGLVICGDSHALSIAFRLCSSGICVAETYSYMPYHKLCSRPHGS